MMDLTIKEITQACGGKLVMQGEMTDTDTCVSSVVIDSRLAEERGVFVATVGERVDGHRFIPEVFEKGAALVVTQKSPEQVEAEHGCSPARWGCYVLVEDTLQALKDIAEAYRRKLSVKVVGITGSVGKTSTKEFIAAVLAEKYSVLKTDGNYNNEIGVPLTLLRIRSGHEAAMVEMGISDFGEMHRLSKMARPDICVITNIGQSHLNNLKDRDGILRAKSEIFDYMAEDGEICLNGEDDKLNVLGEIKGHIPHFFGLGSSPAQEAAAVDIAGRGLWGSDAVLLMKGKPIRGLGAEEKTACGTARSAREACQAAQETACDAENTSCGAEEEACQAAQETVCGAENTSCGAEEEACHEVQYVACHGAQGAACGAEKEPESRIPVRVPLPGSHMVLNAAAAACVGRLLGLTDGQIAAGISHVPAVTGRAHIISHPRQTIIDDCYNANPASVKAALDLLAMADTEKVAILGDMLNLGERSREYHAEVGRYAMEAGADRILCVGEESRDMYQAALEYIEKKGGQANRPANRPEVKAAHYPDREALLEALAADPEALVPRGSTVLVKASHDMGFAQILDFLRNAT